MDKEFAKYVIKKDIIEGQALKLTLLLKGNIRFTIIAIYNFANNMYKEAILEFYNKLKEIISAEKKQKAKVMCIGDFNASYDVAMKQERSNKKMSWKDGIFQILKKNIMVDVNLVYHDKPLNTWNRLNMKSRIDYIWITEDLVPDTIYASTNKVYIFETDHSAVTIYFHKDDLFHTKQIAKKKRHNKDNLQVDYKKIDKEMWEKYAEEMEKLLKKEKDAIDSVEISTKSMNRLWNVVRDIFKKANMKLPKKKGNPNKEVLPKTIVFYKRFLKKLSYILMNLTEKKIGQLGLSESKNCRRFIEKHYEEITEICFKFAISVEGLLGKNIIEFKEIVKNVFKLIQINFAEESKIYKEEKMKFYIQRRCEDLQDNKKRFLDSTLNRKRSKIILDRIVIEKDNVKQLVSDDKTIEKELIEHYKCFAGKKLNIEDGLKGRWINQYKPKQEINEQWYEDVT